MKIKRPWSKLRIMLRSVAAGCVAVAAVPAVGPVVAVACAFIGSAAGLLSIDLPRDRWTQEEIQAYRAKHGEGSK